MNTTVLLLWLFTLILLGWQGFDSYHDLPTVLTTKFSMSGQAQGTSEKDTFYATWYGVIALMSAMIFLIRSITLRSPAKYINIPNRDYWLATSDRRLVCTNRMTTLMMIMFALVNLHLALLFRSIVEYNLEGRTIIPIWWSVVGVPVIVLFTMIAMRRTFQPPGNDRE